MTMVRIKALAALAIVAGSVSGASTAAADTPSEVCTSLDGGSLCIHEYSNGYNVWFANPVWGAKKTLRLGLRCNDGYRYDQGAFTSMPGTNRSYFFGIGLKDWCAPLLYDAAVGGWYEGHYVT
ncbi:hypothetical protein OG689_40820 [Kitasatospora sp. NBC_00240]|uniref:hypothetical protein n=1 Tax=Kitasatospora sp. NBC_00240 TaxID=2903567 RepID=UPI00224DCEA7|nr:hypothetical protein [Kitasatospora sp. NBC_00240]MCX5215512.1 hypothetical protein [Kitasatospora sp. NBC_00240]